MSKSEIQEEECQGTQICTYKNLVEKKVSVKRLLFLESTAEDPIKEVGQEVTKLGEEEDEDVANNSETDDSNEEVEVSKEPLKVQVQVDDEDYEMIANIIEAKVKK